MSLPIAQMDPLSVGQRLLVSFVLAGSFVRSELGFDLNWQLLDWLRRACERAGQSRWLRFDLIAVQTEISNEVFAALHGLSGADRIQTANAEAPRAWLATRR